MGIARHLFRLDLRAAVCGLWCICSFVVVVRFLRRADLDDGDHRLHGRRRQRAISASTACCRSSCGSPWCMISAALLWKMRHLPPDPRRAAVADADLVPRAGRRYAARAARRGACAGRGEPAGDRARYGARHHASRPCHARCRRADRGGQRRRPRRSSTASCRATGWAARFAALIAAAASRGTIPQRSAERADAARRRPAATARSILKLANARYREVTVSSRQGRVVLLFEDITERVRAEERINFMAHYDALTGPAQSRLFRPAGRAPISSAGAPTAAATRPC